MKIVIVDRRGAQSIWFLMEAVAAALEARGREVHCVVWDEVDGRGYAPDRPNVHMIDVGARKTPLHIVPQHVRFGRAFRDLLRDICPDILITNFVVPGALSRIWAQRAGIPVRLSIQHELFSSLAPQLRLINGLGEEATTHFAYVSDMVRRNYGAATDDRHRVIHNGIDIATIEQAEPHPREAGTLALCLPGRLVRVKGQMAALEGFAAIAADHPHAVLEIIGDGPDAKALENKAADLHIASQVRFTGLLSRQATLARMKSASAVLVPSDGTQEGFGLVVAEAMAMGRPILASDIPVFREVAGASDLLRWYGPKDAAAIAKVMDEHLKAAATRPKAGAATATGAASGPVWSVERMARDYADYLEHAWREAR